MKLFRSAILATLSLWLLSSAVSAQEAQQVIVVPTRDLKAGAVAIESALAEKKIEARLAPINAVSGIAQCVGRVLKRDKAKGQIILIDDLDNP